MEKRGRSECYPQTSLGELALSQAVKLGIESREETVRRGVIAVLRGRDK